MATTDANGNYAFSVDQPDKCYIEVDTQGYLYGPVETGGNQFGSDRRSPVFDVNFGSVIDYVGGGLYFPFTTTCVEQCNQNEVIQDCGWGLWNECTCQVSSLVVTFIMPILFHSCSQNINIYPLNSTRSCAVQV